MKKIEAIVRKERFEEICKVLADSGIGGMTVSDVRGFGHHRSGLRDKTKIEIYCDEFQVDQIVGTIQKIAKTESTGDGKIAIFNLERLYRIRTGEEGARAI
ncbi:MAG: P-II family nitrogen regulator, partial [Candidatus Omnitrophica bacterium]|nr:P-II family nitrogen regulator [Candidatus Omnitrophota bacterium]